MLWMEDIVQYITLSFSFLSYADQEIEEHLNEKEKFALLDQNSVVLITGAAGFVGSHLAIALYLWTVCPCCRIRLYIYIIFFFYKSIVGMVMYDDLEQLAVADLPGLIEGASRNHGLGISFLR